MQKFCADRSHWGLLVLLLFLFCGVGCSSLSGESESKIWNGTYIANIAVGGMPVQAAEQELNSQKSRVLEKRISFRLGERTWEATLGGLGVNPDYSVAIQEVLSRQNAPLGMRMQYLYDTWAHEQHINVPFIFDQAVLAENINQLTSDFNSKKATAVRIVVDSKGHLEVEGNTRAERINALQAAEQLAGVLQQGVQAIENSEQNAPINIALVTEKVSPLVNGRSLAELGLEQQLATYTTNFNPAKTERTYNLRLAASAINHQLVAPGATFSFNQVVGPRSTEAGYREALVIVKNEFVPGLGGGVCQVSTTLYNAILLSLLPVAERHPHSLAIDYAPLGLDATVQYPGKDLRFTNNTNGHIFIQTSLQKNSLTIQLFGKKMNLPIVTMNSEVIEKIPPQRVEQPNPELPPGTEQVIEKGKSGSKVRVYRTIGSGTNTNKELISVNTYRPQDTIVQMGPPLAGAPAAEGSVLPGQAGTGDASRVKPTTKPSASPTPPIENAGDRQPARGRR